MTNNEGTLPNEEESFQVVLIDLKKAAEGKIHCVEKSLMGSGNLKFIAISYRWGELHETLVDTGLGYVATITSFALKTLVNLCKTMTRERDLKHMDYVWVDAICVDQTNYERRKATIYHMTDIYERANYIVAVPDLHYEYLLEAHLIDIDILNISYKDWWYIYLLNHGNAAELEACDQQFLDDCSIPSDPHLRRLLINYTDHFYKAFINCRRKRVLCGDAEMFQHLLPIHSPVTHNQWMERMGSDKSATEHIDKLTIDELHTCKNIENCPLTTYYSGDENSLSEFKRTLIPKRSQNLRRIMTWLTVIAKDWTTRVWVVSEFHIAKKKSNKMKYWFMHLDSLCLDEYLFFEFDFTGNADLLDDCVATVGRHHPDAVYQVFHGFMQKQLRQQTFLEKILKTKASCNVDRFHAILPSSEYKRILTNKELVDNWNITSLTSVKLQLYKWMTTEHKLELLFLSAFGETAHVPPTFATTTILWPRPYRYPKIQAYNGDCPCNFDLLSNAISLIKNHNGSYKLNIRPLGYYRHENYRQVTNREVQVDAEEEKTVRKLLHLLSDDSLDLICIYDFADKEYRTRWEFCRTQRVFLLGSFTKNEWIVKRVISGGQYFGSDKGFHHHLLDKDGNGFDIY